MCWFNHYAGLTPPTPLPLPRPFGACPLRAGTIGNPPRARVSEIRIAIRPPNAVREYVGTLNHRGSRQEKTCRARAPKRRTGAPNNHYRGPQQEFTYVGRPLTTTIRATKPKTLRPLPHDARSRPYRGPQQALPGSPTSATGVPSKKYRGAQQKLPGSPTSTTGAPSKKYRGARQETLAKGAAKRDILGRVS